MNIQRAEQQIKNLPWADEPQSEHDLAIRLWYDKMDAFQVAKGDPDCEISDDELSRMREEAAQEAHRLWNGSENT